MLSAVIERMRDETGPLGLRLRNAFVSSIEDGTLAASSALPSERDLAAALGVSRSTLRACLTDLGRMGLVQTRHGLGTVVSGRIPKALTRLSGFTEDVAATGRIATSRVIERRIAPISGDVARRTGLALGTEMMTLVRLRIADEEALSYEIAVVPVAVVGADYDGTTSLYDRMDRAEARPRRILQTLEAVAAPKGIASHLGVVAGAPTLRIAQTGYCAAGSAVEDAISWYRGDRYRYVGEVEG